MASPNFETITTITTTRHRTFERPGSDIKKKGWLRRMKTMKKRYFVLRSTSSSGPARLEYYTSEKNFEKNNLKRSIVLHECFNINKKSDSKHKYAIALYTKDDCFTVIAENSIEQDDWLTVLLEYQLQYAYHDNSREHFEHVWQVSIQAKGLALHPEHKHIRGNHRLCLSSQNLCIVKINTDKPLYTFQLATVRSLAISDCLFRMEVGSLAATGSGELWMQVDDSATAQNMHDSIFQCMKAASMDDTDIKSKERQRSGTMNSTISPRSTSTLDYVNSRRTSGSVQSPNRIREKRPVSCNPVMAFPPYNTPPSTSPLYNSEYNDRLRSDSMESRASHKSKLDDDFFSGGTDTVEAISEEDASYNQLSPDFSSLPSSPNELQEHLKMSPEEEGRGASAYMVMQPGASTPPTGTSGYVEMTTRSQRNTDLSPASSESDRYLNMSLSRPPASSPIPIRGPPDSLYKDMSHCTPLPTVTEGGSNEGYLPMSPTFGQSPFSSAHLKPEPAVCMLSDDTLEFPKRTYSLGSKPPVNTGNKTSGYLDMTINKGVTDKGRSCSAPHLIPQRKLHLDSPTPSASPLSTSMRSDDSESFMEFDFYRPRTASDSYSYRPRASSFGNKSLQAHRPRSSSHGQQARTFKPKKTFDSVRTTSEELRQSMSSCQGSTDSLRMSSSESLRKLSREVRAKTSSLLSTDYLDMSIDKRKTPSPQPAYQQTPTSKPNGYMDMTLGMRTSSPSRSRTPQERSGSFSSGTFSKTRDKMIQERSGSFSSGTSHKILPVSEIPTKKSYSSDKVHNMSTSVDNKPASVDMYMNMDMSSSSSQNINDPNQKSGKDNSRSSSAENLESYVMYEPKVTTRTSANTPHNKQIRPISSDSSIKRSSDRPSKRGQRKKTGSASKSNQWLHNAEQQSSIEKNDEYIEFSPMSKSPDGKAISKAYARSTVVKDSDSVEDSCEYMGFEPGQVAGNTPTTSNQKKSSTPGQIVSQRSYFVNVSSVGGKEPKKLVSSASFSGRTAPPQRFKNKTVSDESEYLNFEPATNVKSQTSRKDETSAGKNRRQKADIKSSLFNPSKVTSVPNKDNKVKTVDEGSNEDSKLKRVANYVEDDYLLTEKLDTTSVPSAGIKQLPIPINPPCILSIDRSPSNSSPGQIKTIKTPDNNKTASNNSLSTGSSIEGRVLDPAHARHSISDLSGFEQLTFPTPGMLSAKLGSSSSVSSTGKNIDKPVTGMTSATPSPSNVVSSMSNLSVNATSPGSQQQLTSGKEVLNYASLDLGSSENIGDDSLRSPRIKSRHASAADEKVEPLSYAQIDFEKCESLKTLTNSKSDISKTGIGESKL